MSCIPSVETIMKKTNFAFTASFVGVSGYPRETGSYTTSPSVEHEGSLWSVRLYPGGIDEESKDYISVMIAYGSRGKARASYKITVLNQKGWKDFQTSSDNVVEFTNYPETGEGVVFGDPRTIARSNLLNPTNGICVDDKLIIKVELTVFGDMEQVVSSTGTAIMHGSPCRRLSIMDDLKNLFLDAESSDLSIICPSNVGDEQVNLKDCCELSISDNKSVIPVPQQDTTELPQKKDTFPAHRFILCLRSPVFKAMLKSTLYESITNQIEIKDFSADVVKTFLSYLYTDDCASTSLEKHGEFLLAMSCKYEVSGLQALCEDHLCSTLSITNVLNVLYLADLYNAHRLKHKALQFIGSHAKEVVQFGSSPQAEGDSVSSSIFQSLNFNLCQEVMQVLAGINPMRAMNSETADMFSISGSSSNYGTPEKAIQKSHGTNNAATIVRHETPHSRRVPLSSYDNATVPRNSRTPALSPSAVQNNNNSVEVINTNNDGHDESMNQATGTPGPLSTL